MQTYSPLLLITPKISQAIYSYREFTKRMDGDLPFYYWTLNERYSDEDLPLFDHCPAIDEDQDLRTHPLRLHRLTINQREDSSIFVSGHAHLTSRHKKSIRQSFHKPKSILPDHCRKYCMYDIPHIKLLFVLQWSRPHFKYILLISLLL